MDFVPDYVYIKVLEARQKKKSNEGLEEFFTVFKQSLELKTVCSKNIKKYLNLVHEPKFITMQTYDELPSQSFSSRFDKRPQTPKMSRIGSNFISRNMPNTQQNMPFIKFLSIVNKEKYKEIKFCSNHFEEFRINDQNIKVSHEKGNFFIYVKNGSNLVFLCSNQFIVHPENLFVIGKYFVRSFIKGGRIFMTKPEVYKGLEEKKYEVLNWIIREPEDSKENSSNIRKKNNLEIVSCSNYPIKKLISTSKLDNKEYYHPLRIDEGSKFCFGDEIFTVQLENNKSNFFR